MTGSIGSSHRTSTSASSGPGAAPRKSSASGGQTDAEPMTRGRIDVLLNAGAPGRSGDDVIVTPVTVTARSVYILRMTGPIRFNGFWPVVGAEPLTDLSSHSSITFVPQASS